MGPSGAIVQETSAKLFHCVVVMGAAMGTGCGSTGLVTMDGGGDAPGSAASSSGGGAAGGFGADGDPGDAAAQGCIVQSALGYNTGCTYPGTCRGTPDAAYGPNDCVHPQDLVCDPATAPTCQCVAGSPQSAADCPVPAQFTCDDWTLPCGCRCVPDAPTTASQCCPVADAGADAGDASAPPPYCATPFTCHTYDPPTGCACVMLPPPIL
jgi:hypothetical protein